MTDPNLRQRILSSTRLAVYIREHNRGSGIGSGDFGDVVLTDIDSGSTVSLTNDTFVDESPAVSPDGKHVIFASAREGDPTALKIIGLGGPRQLYVCSLETGQIGPFDANNLPIMFPQNLQWATDANAVYFFTMQGALCKFALQDSLPQVLVQGEPDLILMGGAISPDESHATISYQNQSTFESGIKIFDLKTRAIHSTYKTRKVIWLGGWSPDGREFNFEVSGQPDSAFVICDVLTNSILAYKFGTESAQLPIISSTMVSETEIALLASRDTLFTPERPGRTQHGVDLAIFDLSTNVLRWVTSDGLDKSDLSFRAK